MNINQVEDFQLERIIDIIAKNHTIYVAEKVVALAQHLELSVKETLNEIQTDYNDNSFIHGTQEFLILSDSEADEREREYVENTIDECYLSEYIREEEKSGRSNPLLTYLDKDKWIDDWCGNRGENLSGYDGVEHEQEINGTWYFIYRRN